MLPMFVIEQIFYSCGPLARTEKNPRSAVALGWWNLSGRPDAWRCVLHLTFALLTIFPPICGSCFVLFSINSLLD